MPEGSAVGSGAERPPPTADWGLSAEEVARRAACGLSNAQPKSNAKSIPRIIRDNAFTFFNAFNLALALLIAAVGEYKEMLFMFVIVSNTAIGIVQEIRSKLIVEKLSLISMPKAHVIRDGLESEVSVGDVVMGDLTALRMGGQVCSDAVVTHGEAEVDESLLTGESEPVMKRPGDELLSGSFIVSGSCRAKVIRVGADNFAAKIALGAKKYKKPKSTLLNSLNGVVRFTGYFILPLGALLFIRSFLFLETPLSSSVTTVAAALLGMMPKGLVLLTSVSLAVGVVKLAMRRTLVQELFSIENLSRVDVLCLDKTGTITEGRMRVSEVLLCGGGPMPIGVEEAMGLFVSSMDDANSTFAALRERFGGAGPDAPLGGARDGAMGAGGYRVGSRVPFSSSRRWGSATFEGLGTVLVGAPEALGGPGPLPEGLAAAASSGDRVVAVAFSESPSDGGVPADARIVAAIVLTDPIREDAAATLDFFRLQNVRVKIISGDSPATVSAIAAKVGFMDHASCVDMTGVPEEEIEGLVEGNSIFGRVDPSQKHAILQALKRKGHTVAMT
ncbi:MAG: HAD-IC family P-type ATPase, partial [Oscillospiraceae bacterium]|nr:HAD-IC family P-type ATPase [Oscillospiraceae bacterium]